MTSELQLAECGSKPRTDAEMRRHRARERRKFEGWMRRYWGGVDLTAVPLMRHSFEYKTTAAQTAWEVWMKFTETTP